AGMGQSKRPTTFKLGVVDWSINYLYCESELHGEPHKDDRDINIFPRGRTEQIIKDTLLHECIHVALEHIIDTTSKMDDKPSEIEEQIVRLVTPRLHELFTNNVELREYIVSKGDKPLDKSKKRK